MNTEDALSVQALPLVLTVISVLCVRSPEHMHFLTANLNPLTNISTFLLTLIPGHRPSALFVWVWCFLEFAYKWDHAVFVSSVSYFTYICLHIPPHCCKGQNFLFNNIPLCINKYTTIYSSTNGYLGGIHILVTVNYGVINTGMQTSLPGTDFISFYM